MKMVFKGWAMPGDYARTIHFEATRVAARRAERILAWLNRCSDLLWLMARALERAES